jgi:hypothetical protein
MYVWVPIFVGGKKVGADDVARAASRIVQSTSRFGDEYVRRIIGWLPSALVSYAVTKLFLGERLYKCYHKTWYPLDRSCVPPSWRLPSRGPPRCALVVAILLAKDLLAKFDVCRNALRYRHTQSPKHDCDDTTSARAADHVEILTRKWLVGKSSRKLNFEHHILEDI